MNRITTVAITAMHAVTLGLILAILGLTSHAGDTVTREPRPIYSYESPSVTHVGLRPGKRAEVSRRRSWTPRDPYLGFRPVTDPGRPDAESARRGYRPPEAELTAAHMDAINHERMPAAPLLKGLKVGQSIVEAIVR